MNGESSLYDPSPVSDAHFVSIQTKSLNSHYFKNVKNTTNSTNTWTPRDLGLNGRTSLYDKHYHKVTHGCSNLRNRL